VGDAFNVVKKDQSVTYLPNEMIEIGRRKLGEHVDLLKGGWAVLCDDVPLPGLKHTTIFI
jgi:hypothetical protein